MAEDTSPGAMELMSRSTVRDVAESDGVDSDADQKRFAVSRTAR
jgi:hypothetical protein